ncbi:putative F-box domain, Agenet-like domain, Agenet domain, plant type [Medicago truncatula]|uniref:Putative F-box domain, Agenet-like domain, Agenet domain, plant type n=1 Tax=Medicago truncatula TaxID=3880 RepID=A0A396IF39_MEDTR|nr:putative F-box domain, Agenet-like domain, Agenet domain, plant type [Medicago truncatula]
MVPKPKFNRGSAVEVSIEPGSWFPGTVVRWASQDKLLVEFGDLDVKKPIVVHLHQLRPVPTPESDDWHLRTGDKVEAFWKQRWWEGYVSKDLGNGRFRVYFTESKEMVFSKRKLRVRRQWINDKWVPPIIYQQLKNYKELFRELKMPRWETRLENRRNWISELPDCILLHIMSFLEARDVVRTCILSKRWKDLCKRVTTLKYILPSAQTLDSFKSWIFSCRDHSCSLFNLTISTRIQQGEEALYPLIEYALFHNVQHLKININPSFRPKSDLLPLISVSHSLTFLKLSYGRNFGVAVCPKSLRLPALRTLYLKYVNFVATHHHYADPFSNCHELNNLVLRDCSLIQDAKVLCISNNALSSLTISSVAAQQFSLSTPNLKSFTFLGSFVFHRLLSSTCNLSFLQQVNIDGLSYIHKEASTFLRWLQVLANVKILKIGYSLIQTIQNVSYFNILSPLYFDYTIIWVFEYVIC